MNNQFHSIITFIVNENGLPKHEAEEFDLELRIGWISNHAHSVGHVAEVSMDNGLLMSESFVAEFSMITPHA